MRHAAVALAAVALSAAACGGGATEPTAGALTRTSAADRLAYPARDVRAAARPRAAQVPLPAGGNFNGIRWELATGPVDASTIDGVLQYNAACQWLRAWRRARPRRGRALAMLRRVPSWSALRGTPAGAVFARVAAQAGAGGGEQATAVLAACDASHAREVEYATRLGLTPSR